MKLLAQPYPQAAVRKGVPDQAAVMGVMAAAVTAATAVMAVAQQPASASLSTVWAQPVVAEPQRVATDLNDHLDDTKEAAPREAFLREADQAAVAGAALGAFAATAAAAWSAWLPLAAAVPAVAAAVLAAALAASVGMAVVAVEVAGLLAMDRRKAAAIWAATLAAFRVAIRVAAALSQAQAGIREA